MICQNPRKIVIMGDGYTAMNHQDNYPEAAVRHYLDGVFLQQAGWYDNSLCHYAFSVECAAKAFAEQFWLVYPGSQGRKLHNVSDILKSISDYSEILGTLDSRLSLIMGVVKPPTTLFHDHPERRYSNDTNYHTTDVDSCREFTEIWLEQVVLAAIDGKLQYSNGRDPIWLHLIHQSLQPSRRFNPGMNSDPYLDCANQADPIWPYREVIAGRNRRWLRFTRSKVAWGELLLWLRPPCF